MNKVAKGSFTNHVDKILAFFDHLPPCVDIFYGINLDKKWKFLDPLPTSSCKRSLWTIPKSESISRLKDLWSSNNVQATRLGTYQKSTCSNTWDFPWFTDGDNNCLVFLENSLFSFLCHDVQEKNANYAGSVHWLVLDWAPASVLLSWCYRRWPANLSLRWFEHLVLVTLSFIHHVG